MTIMAGVTGILMGIALGMLGGGGSIVAVPAFVYLLGMEAKVAIAMSLGVVGVASAVGVVGHWRLGNVRVGMALVFGAVAMVGTYLGARWARFLSDEFQLLLFAVVMLMASVAMLRSRTPAGSPQGGRFRTGLIAVEGLAVGILTGMVGVGGGFLIVPALVVFGGLSMSHAVGTSLLIIVLKSAAGFAGYVAYVAIPWDVLAGFGLTSAVGILLGTWATHHVSQLALKRTFAVMLVVVGVSMLYANRNVLGRHTVESNASVVLTGKGIEQ